MVTKERAQIVPKNRLRSLKDLVLERGGTLWFWRRMIWQGKLPVVQIGKKQWVDERDAIEFIEKHKK